MSLTESIVEDAALTWFHLRQGYGGQVGELGYAVGHGPQLAHGVYARGTPHYQRTTKMKQFSISLPFVRKLLISH